MKLKFLHIAPLEVYFRLGTFLAEARIVKFWPKTMDYIYTSNKKHFLKNGKKCRDVIV